MTSLQINPDDFLMIHDHIIECRGRGHCLPPGEVSLIQEWLLSARNSDDVILALDDFLPSLYDGERTVPVSLKRIDRKMRRRIQELNERRSAPQA
jgi:hypothetical protein